MDQLSKWRKEASEHSEGTSADHIYRSVLQELQTRNLLGGHVLDFGAGKGKFCQVLDEQNSFSKITACDLMSLPGGLSKQVHWIQVDLNEPLPLEDSSVDLLCSVELIEHLENPRAVVREWERLVRPGGTVVCTTPNNESVRSLLSLVTRGHFVDFNDSCYPAHITALLKKDLERVFKEAGFSSIEFAYSGHGTLPKWTKWSWQQLSMGKLQGRWFSDNILVFAKKAAEN